MSETNLKIGDKIYHLSESRVAWVVEKIEDDLVHCSTLMKDTLVQKKEKFLITSIKKIENSSPVTFSGPKRNNHW